MLIVGSKALLKLYNIPDRVAKDTDIIGTYAEYQILKSVLNPESVKETEYVATMYGITPNELYPDITTKNVEILLSDNSESLKLYVEYESAQIGVQYASAEVLFSLKKSHIHFNTAPIKFAKHIKDYCFLYDKLINDKLSNITKINFKETELRIGKLKTPSLNKSVKEFFKQSDGLVKSFFVHDDIHIAVAHYDKPLYQRMQYDLLQAKCEKVLWEKFTFEEKCKCVLEETMVIALERKILPMIFGKGKYFTSDEALKWALMRVCTTLCSGWFREFATNNYFKILDYSNPNYVENFLSKIDSCEIKRIEYAEAEVV